MKRDFFCTIFVSCSTKMTSVYIYAMKRMIVLFCPVIMALPGFSQKPSAKTIQEIKDEANALYALESANTTSLDLFYDNEFKADAIKGFFSYKDKDSIRTIFYAQIDTTDPKFKQQPDSVKKLYKEEVDYYAVARSFSYGRSLNKKNAVLSDVSRKMTDEEKLLMRARLAIFKEFDADTAKYKRYLNTSISMLPIDYKKYLKIYLITLPNRPGVVIFGNDYCFEYDKKTLTLTKKEKLHQVYYNVSAGYNGKKNDPLKYTFHTHKAGDSPFITATDVCLLMLYKGGVEWEQHWVYSDKWVSTYTLYNGNLQITDKKTFQKQTKPKEKDPGDPEQQNENNGDGNGDGGGK